jgi:phage-related baseplate assembly protein
VFGPALLGVGTKAAIEDPATSVADDPAVPASVVVAGEGNANRGSAHAYVAHTGPTRETIIAAIEVSPAAVPDHAAVVVATGRDADLHRLAIGFGGIAESILAILID